MQNIKTDLRRGTFIVGAIMALAFLLQSYDAAALARYPMGPQAELNVVPERWIGGVCIRCRPENVQPSSFLDDSDYVLEIKKARKGLDLAFWCKRDIPDSLLLQNALVIRIRQGRDAINASRLIGQKSCIRSATVSYLKHDSSFEWTVGFDHIANVERVSKVNGSADGGSKHFLVDNIGVTSSFSLAMSLVNRPLRDSQVFLSDAQSLDQDQERDSSKPHVEERGRISPDRQPMFPRPLYPIFGAVLLVAGGWWSGRSLILGHAVGHAVGWFGGFIGTVLLLLGLANLYAPLLP